MLLTRLYSAFIGIVLLAIVMGAPGIYMNIALTLISLVGLHELYRAFRQAGLKPIAWFGYLSTIVVLFSDRISLEKGKMYLLAAVFAVILLLCTNLVLSKGKLNFIDVSITIFSILYIPFLLSFIGFTRKMDNGVVFVWLTLIGGWVTDTMAYFSGRFLGKNKLIPSISPKKTIEGAIGGVLGCTLIIFLYGIIVLNKYYHINIAPINFVIMGIILSVAAQFGDLTASSIKRAAKIKDFGTIMPGHGGVIDRFDSILFVAPIVYFYLQFLGY